MCLDIFLFSGRFFFPKPTFSHFTSSSSLHPRLCRNAVLSVKPTFFSLLNTSLSACSRLDYTHKQHPSTEISHHISPSPLRLSRDLASARNIIMRAHPPSVSLRGILYKPTFSLLVYHQRAGVCRTSACCAALALIFTSLSLQMTRVLWPCSVLVSYEH